MPKIAVNPIAKSGGTPTKSYKYLNPIKGFLMFTWHSISGWYKGLKHVVTTKDVAWTCTQTFFSDAPYPELVKRRTEYVNMERRLIKELQHKYENNKV